MTSEEHRLPSVAESPPPFMEGIFAVPSGGRDPHLLGGACSRCGERFYPRPPRCRRCLGPVDECSVGSEGSIYSYTVIRTRAPLGLPEPYAIGYVDLAESGLRVFGLLDPDAIGVLGIGARVRLEVGPLGRDSAGNSCLRPYFALVREVQQGGPTHAQSKGAS